MKIGYLPVTFLKLAARIIVEKCICIRRTKTLDGIKLRLLMFLCYLSRPTSFEFTRNSFLIKISTFEQWVCSNFWKIIGFVSHFKRNVFDSTLVPFSPEFIVRHKNVATNIFFKGPCALMELHRLLFQAANRDDFSPKSSRLQPKFSNRPILSLWLFVQSINFTPHYQG